MIFFVTELIPGHKLKEVVKNFKIPKLPEYFKKWEFYFTPDGPSGVKIYNLIMVERGKGDEALLEITKLYNRESQLEGYSWKIETLIGLKDAITTLPP